MATAAAAAATIGISVELVVTACTALGVGVVGAIFTGKLIEQVRDWIKSRGVSSEISDHVMKKKHKFNDKCGADCILKVAYDIKSGSSWLADNGIPIIRGTGYCRHGWNRSKIVYSSWTWPMENWNCLSYRRLQG